MTKEEKLYWEVHEGYEERYIIRCNQGEMIKLYNNTYSVGDVTYYNYKLTIKEASKNTLMLEEGNKYREKLKELYEAIRENNNNMSRDVVNWILDGECEENEG